MHLMNYILIYDYNINSKLYFLNKVKLTSTRSINTKAKMQFLQNKKKLEIPFPVETSKTTPFTAI